MFPVFFWISTHVSSSVRPRNDECRLHITQKSQQGPSEFTELHFQGILSLPRVGNEHNWLVVSTHLKNLSQIGNLPQVGVKIKNIWNHHLDNDKSQAVFQGF